MIIELCEFSQRLQEYRKLLKRLQDEQASYQTKRERLSKLSQRRCSAVRKSDVVCYMCNTSIKLEDSNSFATCRGCEKLVCRNEERRCCEWISAIGIWECQNCRSSRVIQQKAGEWLLNQLTVRLQNPGPVNLKNDALLGLYGADSDDAQSSTSSISSNQKIKVREFIEELLSTMLNGPLDDVSVGQLMKNENYLEVFHRYHSHLSRCLYNLELSIHQSLSDLPICEGQKFPDSPSDKHFELRKLLQRILDEVVKLPELLNQSGHPLRPEEHLPYFSPKKYEQLLATAVLNKVVEDYRNPKNFEHVETTAELQQQTKQQLEVKEAVPPTTITEPVGSAPDAESTFDINHNKVSGDSQLIEDNLRQMSVNDDEVELKEALSRRSLSESDESYLSDYIQKHTVPLPDLSDTTGSSPEDDSVSLKSNTTDGTWEENWLFKKRQLKSTESSIAMLVPSPTEEVKALIGDQNADEVSDLSETGSDFEGYESDSVSKDAPLSSNTSVPHTEKPVEEIVQDSLISINSTASNEPVLSEAKNSLLLTEMSNHASNQSYRTDNLIFTAPTTVKAEAANSTLLEIKQNQFECNTAEPVLACHQSHETGQVETDDVKLMQERIQNAPKQLDAEGNILYPIGIARTIPGNDNQTPECDRKEIPIDRAYTDIEHTRPSILFQSVEVDHMNNVNNPSSSNIDESNNSTNSNQTNTKNISTKPINNASELVEPKQQPLSPHPIALTITELFDRSVKPSLTSISEELHEPDESLASRSAISPVDSFTTADESDYKTVSVDNSETSTSVGIDPDTSLILEDPLSLDSLDSSLSYENCRNFEEEEFYSMNQGDDVDEDVLPGTSGIELLQAIMNPQDMFKISESPAVVVYVCDPKLMEFVEEMDVEVEDDMLGAKIEEIFDPVTDNNDQGSYERVVGIPEELSERTESDEPSDKDDLTLSDSRSSSEEVCNIFTTEENQDDQEMLKVAESPEMSTESNNCGNLLNLQEEVASEKLELDTNEDKNKQSTSMVLEIPTADERNDVATQSNNCEGKENPTSESTNSSTADGPLSDIQHLASEPILRVSHKLSGESSPDSLEELVFSENTGFSVEPEIGITVEELSETKMVQDDSSNPTANIPEIAPSIATHDDVIDNQTFNNENQEIIECNKQHLGDKISSQTENIIVAETNPITEEKLLTYSQNIHELEDTLKMEHDLLSDSSHDSQEMIESGSSPSKRSIIAAQNSDSTEKQHSIDSLQDDLSDSTANIFDNDHLPATGDELTNPTSDNNFNINPVEKLLIDCPNIREPEPVSTVEHDSLSDSSHESNEAVHSPDSLDTHLDHDNFTAIDNSESKPGEVENLHLDKNDIDTENTDGGKEDIEKQNNQTLEIFVSPTTDPSNDEAILETAHDLLIDSKNDSNEAIELAGFESNDVSTEAISATPEQQEDLSGPHESSSEIQNQIITLDDSESLTLNNNDVDTKAIECDEKVVEIESNKTLEHVVGSAIVEESPEDPKDIDSVSDASQKEINSVGSELVIAEKQQPVESLLDNLSDATVSVSDIDNLRDVDDESENLTLKQEDNTTQNVDCGNQSASELIEPILQASQDLLIDSNQDSQGARELTDSSQQDIRISDNTISSTSIEESPTDFKNIDSLSDGSQKEIKSASSELDIAEKDQPMESLQDNSSTATEILSDKDILRSISDEIENLTFNQEDSVTQNVDCDSLNVATGNNSTLESMVTSTMKPSNDESQLIEPSLQTNRDLFIDSCQEPENQASEDTINSITIEKSLCDNQKDITLIDSELDANVTDTSRPTQDELENLTLSEDTDNTQNIECDKTNVENNTTTENIGSSMANLSNAEKQLLDPILTTPHDPLIDSSQDSREAIESSGSDHKDLSVEAVLDCNVHHQPIDCLQLDLLDPTESVSEIHHPKISSDNSENLILNENVVNINSIECDKQAVENENNKASDKTIDSTANSVTTDIKQSLGDDSQQAVKLFFSGMDFSEKHLSMESSPDDADIDSSITTQDEVENLAHSRRGSDTHVVECGKSNVEVESSTDTEDIVRPLENPSSDLLIDSSQDTHEAKELSDSENKDFSLEATLDAIQQHRSSDCLQEDLPQPAELEKPIINDNNVDINSVEGDTNPVENENNKVLEREISSTDNLMSSEKPLTDIKELVGDNSQKAIKLIDFKLDSTEKYLSMESFPEYFSIPTADVADINSSTTTQDEVENLTHSTQNVESCEMNIEVGSNTNTEDIVGKLANPSTVEIQPLDLLIDSSQDAHEAKELSDSEDKYFSFEVTLDTIQKQLLQEDLSQPTESLSEMHHRIVSSVELENQSVENENNKVSEMAISSTDNPITSEKPLTDSKELLADDSQKAIKSIDFRLDCTEKHLSMESFPDDLSIPTADVADIDSSIATQDEVENLTHSRRGSDTQNVECDEVKVEMENNTDTEDIVGSLANPSSVEIQSLDPILETPLDPLIDSSHDAHEAKELSHSEHKDLSVEASLNTIQQHRSIDCLQEDLSQPAEIEKPILNENNVDISSLECKKQSVENENKKVSEKTISSTDTSITSEKPLTDIKDMSGDDSQEVIKSIDFKLDSTEKHLSMESFPDDLSIPTADVADIDSSRITQDEGEMFTLSRRESDTQNVDCGEINVEMENNADTVDIVGSIANPSSVEIPLLDPILETSLPLIDSGKDAHEAKELSGSENKDCLQEDLLQPTELENLILNENNVDINSGECDKQPLEIDNNEVTEKAISSTDNSITSEKPLTDIKEILGDDSQEAIKSIDFKLDSTEKHLSMESFPDDLSIPTTDVVDIDGAGITHDEGENLTLNKDESDTQNIEYGEMKVEIENNTTTEKDSILKSSLDPSIDSSQDTHEVVELPGSENKDSVEAALDTFEKHATKDSLPEDSSKPTENISEIRNPENTISFETSSLAVEEPLEVLKVIDLLGAKVIEATDSHLDNTEKQQSVESLLVDLPNPTASVSDIDNSSTTQDELESLTLRKDEAVNIEGDKINVEKENKITTENIVSSIANDEIQLIDPILETNDPLIESSQDSHEAIDISSSKNQDILAETALDTIEKHGSTDSLQKDSSETNENTSEMLHPVIPSCDEQTVENENNKAAENTTCLEMKALTVGEPLEVSKVIGLLGDKVIEVTDSALDNTEQQSMESTLDDLVNSPVSVADIDILKTTQDELEKTLGKDNTESIERDKVDVDKENNITTENAVGSITNSSNVEIQLNDPLPKISHDLLIDSSKDSNEAIDLPNSENKDISTVVPMDTVEKCGFNGFQEDLPDPSGNISEILHPTSDDLQNLTLNTNINDINSFECDKQTVQNEDNNVSENTNSFKSDSIAVEKPLAVLKVIDLLGDSPSGAIGATDSQLDNTEKHYPVESLKDLENPTADIDDSRSTPDELERKNDTENIECDKMNVENETNMTTENIGSIANSSANSELNTSEKHHSMDTKDSEATLEEFENLILNKNDRDTKNSECDKQNVETEINSTIETIIDSTSKTSSAEVQLADPILETCQNLQDASLQDDLPDATENTTIIHQNLTPDQNDIVCDSQIAENENDLASENTTSSTAKPITVKKRLTDDSKQPINSTSFELDVTENNQSLESLPDESSTVFDIDDSNNSFSYETQQADPILKIEANLLGDSGHEDAILLSVGSENVGVSTETTSNVTKQKQSFDSLHDNSSDPTVDNSKIDRPITASDESRGQVAECDRQDLEKETIPSPDAMIITATTPSTTEQQLTADSGSENREQLSTESLQKDLSDTTVEVEEIETQITSDEQETPSNQLDNVNSDQSTSHEVQEKIEDIPILCTEIKEEVVNEQITNSNGITSTTEDDLSAESNVDQIVQLPLPVTSVSPTNSQDISVTHSESQNSQEVTATTIIAETPIADTSRTPTPTPTLPDTYTGFDLTEPSSPEDTSTEAIAGSTDRTSTPEEVDPLLLGEEKVETSLAAVTKQMRLYCEELKGILYAHQPLEQHGEALEKVENDPSEVTSTRTAEVGVDALEQGVLISPLEAFEIKSAEYNQSLRHIDYVEEDVLPAEDTDHLFVENMNLVTACNAVNVIPRVEEHAVRSPILVRYTPSPEPIPSQVFERQIEDVQAILSYQPADQEKSQDAELLLQDSEDLDINFVEEDLLPVEVYPEEHPLKSTILAEPIPSQEYERQITATVEDEQSIPSDQPIVYDQPQDSELILQDSADTAEELDRLSASPDMTEQTIDDITPPFNRSDSELSSLCFSLPTVCVLNNNNSTNPTTTADTNLHEQPPSFVSETSLLIVESDSSEPPIPLSAQSETNGHASKENDPVEEEIAEDMLIPGSIAEREHLKWQNASPIANNPYSPDVLQKRLSESSNRSTYDDFDRLTSKDISECYIESKEDDDIAENDRSLQSVIGGNPTQYTRYGRDYYINDAKRASGTRKQVAGVPATSPSTDDEKSLLLSQKQDQPLSERLTPPSSPVTGGEFQSEESPVEYSSTYRNLTPAPQSEDIFCSGRPAKITTDDSIPKKATSVAREMFLAPTDEPIVPQSVDSSSEMSINSRPDESLTYSEDSDVTRIYEIGTGETKLIHGDVITSSSNALDEANKQYGSEVVSEEILEIMPQTNSFAPTEDDRCSSPTIDRSNLIRPRYVRMKQLSPETIRFFSPKKAFLSNSSSLTNSALLSQSSSEIRDLPHQHTHQYHSSLHLDFPASRSVPIHEFIIEKEVMEVLPSVKELAKCYVNSGSEAVPKPVLKPRDFIRQSTDMINEEPQSAERTGMPLIQDKNLRMYKSTSSISAADEIREIRRLNLEAYNQQTFIPMAPGHSITARSLSKQIRDDLKTNITDDLKVHGGHSSPERPSSPVFEPGHLRSSIQFFENLKNK
ncbi:uncharacterized protein LOC131691876 isoform X3 [Topomyia yanbarensis]|uniref:uncharacterized protein LOC131691876 isoform X3 n=1 Tax=Topomyia yanbarensis TaxID=2498891 RepID=UPI00273A93A4|nr:uncharacterized protein LOC131691876 isoform X3 [Topomyia yanbarensis]